MHMRFYFNSETLFIRGTFRAASTGIEGGIQNVSTLLNHSVPPDWSSSEPAKDLDLVIAAAGCGSDYFGLLTAVPMKNLCIFQYDFITVFITAGISARQQEGAGTINIIVHAGEGLVDAALLELIMVATEAKAEALAAMSRTYSGTPTDAVIAACEGETRHVYGGRLTKAGQRVRDAVLFGVPEALNRYEGTITVSNPTFFIFSRFQGEHWVRWDPENCPYYPCHFPGQRCDFCYCPFYPCGDESLGEWSTGSNGGRVWNCSKCTLLHEPEVADYLIQYPEASREELVRFREKIRAKK
jgi:adenosylcobinamide hydrolase